MEYVFVILVALIYGGLNFYIGIRGLNAINAQVPINSVAYWLILSFLATTYILSYALKNYLPERVEKAFSIIGGYWMVAFVYFLSIVIIIDILRLISKKVPIIPDVVRQNSMFVTLGIIVAVAVVMVIGTYNAFVPVIRDYSININKSAGSMTKLKCAMISDVHLGEIIGKDRLHNAVEAINSLEPDIVVIAGDLIDRDIASIKDNALDELLNIKSKYGVYAVLGNHEYYGRTADEITQAMQSRGVNVLRDKQILVNDSFYIVGREDKTASTRGFGFQRKPLAQLLQGINKDLPVILIDHQPSGLSEPENEKIDLQLSGHTHAGQFFPINLITHKIFTKDWGYYDKDSFNLVVSSGFGTWGPTVRLGSQSEVCDIKINFNK